MRHDTRLPPDTAVRAYGEHGFGAFPFLVVAARPPHGAAPETLAEALTALGTNAIYRGFRDGEPWDDRDVDHVAGFLSKHRGIAMLGFTQERGAAECVRSLEGRRQ